MKPFEVPLLCSDKFYILTMNNGTVRISFGHATNSEVSYHTGVSMTRADAKEMADLVNKFLKDSEPEPVTRQQRRSNERKNFKAVS